MRDIIIVTSSAGGGKTTARLGLAKFFEAEGLPCKFISDGRHLVKIVEEDRDEKMHVHPHEGDPAFCITSQYPLDETVRRVVNEIPVAKERQVILVELARGIGNGWPNLDISFGRLLRLIPEPTWERAVVLYIDTPWELRDKWNRERRGNSRVELEGQSFYCPSLAMEVHFRESDFLNTLAPRLEVMGVPVQIIGNHTEGYLEFQKKVELAATEIWRSHLSGEGQMGLRRESLL